MRYRKCFVLGGASGARRRETYVGSALQSQTMLRSPDAMTVVVPSGAMWTNSTGRHSRVRVVKSQASVGLRATCDPALGGAPQGIGGASCGVPDRALTIWLAVGPRARTIWHVRIHRLPMHRQPMYTGVMREPTYFILVSLAKEPLHGYGVAKRAEELSGGGVRIGAGTLYGALDRLVSEGLVVVDREEIVEGRPRRYYRLTDAGSSAVAEEVVRMRAALSAVRDSGGFSGLEVAL